MRGRRVKRERQILKGRYERNKEKKDSLRKLETSQKSPKPR